MDRSQLADVVAVSRYWTPEHLDVTNVPMTYARPKPPWIDGLDRRRRVADDIDRLTRRRMHSGALVDPSDIPVLPPVVAAKNARPASEARLAGVYGAVARLFPTRRIPA
jgi:hypothetical protein